MCGICGFVGRQDRALLERMTSVLAHRGPDSVGYHSTPEASLGFRRLSIIDLETGDQPIPNEDGTVWLILNGEVYNFPTLRDKLERRGHRFSTHSDAEVAVHLYEEAGEELLGRLEGMFALAIWDARRGRLLLARDRLGIKPLYYHQRNGALFFASEAKALLLDPQFRRRLNPTAVDRLLTYLYLPGPDTLLEGIQRLPAGHYLRWEAGRCEVRRYWRPRVGASRPIREEDAVREFRARFEQAVSSHLVSDVPVGVLLSGGLDSAGVAAQASRLLDRPLQTFTIGLAGAEDERPIARRLAERLGTEHHEIELPTERLLGDLPRLVWHLEEPTPISFLPMFYLSEYARRQVKAVLIGEGADELFAGYRRLLPYSSYLPGLPGGLRNWIYRQILHSLEKSPAFGLAAGTSLTSPGLRVALSQPTGSTPLAAALHFEQTYELPDYQLHRVDRMSMAWGLEARVPYLDHRLVEFVNSLPDNLKLRGFRRKYLLRRALAGLVPEDILGGSKRGFSKPFREWFSAEFIEAARGYVDDHALKERSWLQNRSWKQLLQQRPRGWRQRRYGSQLFLLVTLEIYCRLFVDAPVEQVATPPPLRDLQTSGPAATSPGKAAADPNPLPA